MNSVDFRAWDTVENHMILDFTNYAGWQAIKNMGNVWRDERYVKQMFTGKYDLHDKKIYDGDLLRNTIFGDIWVVDYKDAMFIVKLIGHDVEEPLGNLAEFEVIGNVFEQ